MSYSRLWVSSPGVCAGVDCCPASVAQYTTAIIRQAIRRMGRRRNSERRRVGCRHFLERAGCGAVLLGTLGCCAGAIWSAALGFGGGVGALFGGLGMAIPGFLLVPLGIEARDLGFPPAFFYVGLLLFTMLLGGLIWLIRVL